jgi:hypothetical protein
VDLQIAFQSRFQLCYGGEAGLLDDLRDTAIEALNHAVRLWMMRRNQPVLNVELFAETVEDMLPVGTLPPQRR